MLRCFLKDAEAKKHESEMVRKTIKDIKEIVLDAEDIVETFLLKKELVESSSNIVKRLPYVTIKRMGLAFDMKIIRKRISQVIRDMQSLGVQKVLVDDRSMQALQLRERETRQTFSRDDEDHLVGIESNVKIVVAYLLEGDSSQVVSITGMGGLGKTTLARQVYNHEKIKSHFPGLAWVCVSQQFERKGVWQTILRQLIRPECDVSKMMEEELQEKIVGVFETQKALIVIDDIWRKEDWDLIKKVFLPKKGWKVLLTSRNEEVALHADKQCVTFKPECLTFEESWDLFQRTAFPIKDTAEFKINENMKEIGKEMIKHCGGLPLALKVLGRLLGEKHALHEWERIYESISSNMAGGFEDVFHVLCLSFEELPVYLKQCFLYLAIFPEDYEISVAKLSFYWAAERIPRPRYYDGASIREVADAYIEELVKRNMVISKRDVDTLRFETCQLHDMMREVCLSKSEEENFVETIETSTANSESPCKSRRLAVVHQFGKTFNGDMEVKNPSLRTLLFLEYGKLKATSLFFKRHKLIRVLDLSWVRFEGGKVPSSIGKLIHLRYLSLKRSKVTQLPSSMRNLKKLLYLDVSCSSVNVVYMPNIFNEMRDLAFLCLPESLDDQTKLELGNLVKLETLKNFSTKHGRVTDLQGMTRLRSLSISIKDERYSIETLSSSLSKLSHLESLTIDNKELFYTPSDDDEEGFVWDFVNLKQLKLEIYMPRLPDAQRFPSHLTTIHLEHCRLKEDPMPILEKLLHLKEIILHHRSFSGRRMVCSTGGFRQLEKLDFRGLKEWEEWIVEEGSMPLLHSLDIRRCPKLKELPDELRFITNLECLSVDDMGEEFNLRLLEGYLPSQLTTISLSDCFTEDPMPILEKFLHLKDVSLKGESFCGRRMVCSRGGFPQLQKLRFEGLEEWEEWIVEEGSMPLLHTLKIDSCPKLEELPDGLRFITSLKDLTVAYSSIRRSETFLPSHLTTIYLRECRLKEDPMPILEKLLHLKVINLDDRSFCGRRMVCSRDGFPQLQKLYFNGLNEWEEWIVEEGSMPLLHSLDIWRCPKLKELPDGLRFITSLKSLNCYYMAKGWEKRHSEGGEDYYKVRHIPFVEFRQ
ncbi:hypothetical protein Bca52824_029906 [Brassica carinata]|uniref:Disease resistance protein n=1 Tax=Brassica carinata TaxID=52824 RepID=A0A8X7S9I9_BRACI|nr:hypothetical protein Bca52824_029906 [Brassica carinata]